MIFTKRDRESLNLANEKLNLVIQQQAIMIEAAKKESLSNYPEIVKTAFDKSERSFLTLADNIFYTALKHNPKLLEELKKRLDKMFTLRDRAQGQQI